MKEAIRRLKAEVRKISIAVTAVSAIIAIIAIIAVIAVIAR